MIHNLINIGFADDTDSDEEDAQINATEMEEERQEGGDDLGEEEESEGEDDEEDEDEEESDAEDGIEIVEENSSALDTIDPINYDPCPDVVEQQRQFIKLVAYSIIKMVHKHNDMLLAKDRVDDQAILVLTNRVGESYHKKAGELLRKSHLKRDILVESELIVKENIEQFPHIARDTESNNLRHFINKRKRARELLSTCTTEAKQACGSNNKVKRRHLSPYLMSNTLRK